MQFTGVNDPARLDVLRRLYRFDEPRDRGFDQLAEAVRTALDVPVALITLVEEDRQLLVSSPGLKRLWAERRQTPLSHSFCQHVVNSEAPLLITDAREHPLVRDNLAITDLDVVAYAGIPLRTHDGYVIGSLCAIDRQPREWSETETALLKQLATCVLYRMELKEAVRIADRQARDAAATMREYRDLLDHAHFAIYRSDPEGHLHMANEALAVMLGYDSVEEVLKLDLAHDIYVDSAERLRLKQQFALVDRVGPVEAVWKKRDGSKLSVRLTGRQIRASDGSIRWYEIFAEDVTERRQLETELRHSQKMEAVGRLAAGVAHDFNNLLTAITGHAAFLLDDLESDTQPWLDAREILQTADRAASLTRQLLAFGHKQVRQPKLINLNGLVLGLHSLLRRTTREDIGITLDLDPKVGMIEADAGQMEQVLVNLVVNARDAMPKGGDVVVRTYTSAGMPGSPAGGVMLEVQDCGIGMDSETVARAFEPFFTTKGPGKGTGLGLSTVYSIAQQSGGSVQIETALGEGTTIRVLFPEAAEQTRETERQSDQPSPSEPIFGRTILVIDDDAEVRKIAARSLRVHGHRVLEAATPAEALAVAAAERIDILVTDVVMPEMSGRDLAEQVLRVTGHIPVLFMSGYSDDVITRHGVLERGLNFIEKPFTPKALAQAVAAVL